MTLETARELRRLGHDVAIFTGYPGSRELKDDQRFDRYSYDGFPVERFHHAYVPMGPVDNVIEAEYNNPFFAAHFRGFLQCWKPDMVHFFHLQRLSASAIAVCHDLGIPTALTPTDFWPVCFTNQLRLPDGRLCEGPDCLGGNCIRHVAALSPGKAIRQVAALLPDWAARQAARLSTCSHLKNLAPFRHVKALAGRAAFMVQQLNKIDRVLAPTRMMERTLTSFGLQPEKVIFCSFGIDLKPFQNREKVEGKGPLRIGYIGTLSEPKGVHVLIQAVRALPETEPVELKIYGRDKDFPAYAATIRSSADGDRRIHFCGTFPNNQIGTIFADLDVLVVPSLWYENTPLVIYSAHAAGCPVIATNLGGMAEVVHHGQDGLLFESGDAGALAELLKQVCHDRKLLRRLTDNVQKPKSIEEYVQELLCVYIQMTGSIPAGNSGTA
nr:glycosyltransferase [Geotalea sp. SG265]